MKVLRTTFLLLVAVLAASVVFAQGTRGTARVAGKVVGADGKPIEGVEVRAQMAGESQIMTAKTNDKGEWSINGIASGDWTLDFVKEGLETVQRVAKVAEGARVNNLNLTMAPGKPKTDPNAEIQKEAARAEELLKAGQNAEARKVYEALLVKYPEVVQLNNLIARTYAAEGNNAKAIEHARMTLAKDPNSVETKLLLAYLLQATGEKDESTKILNSIDVSTAKDPILFINVAINQINDGKTEEAIALLTKLAAQFPNEANIFYYRGLAYLRQQKMAEAKADFEKFVAANPPNSEKELAEAKKILEQMAKK
jgi:tetratricopeptide (TPR) repeat protein